MAFGSMFADTNTHVKQEPPVSFNFNSPPLPPNPFTAFLTLKDTDDYKMPSSKRNFYFFLPPIFLGQHLEECCDHSPSAASLEHAGSHHDFDLLRVAWAIQCQLGPKSIETYLNAYDASKVKKDLCSLVKVDAVEPGYPILYFAVERNSPEIIRILCKAGASASHHVSSTGQISNFSVLSYAVLSAEYALSDTTDTVIALLAMGADPEDIPRDMWENYLVAPRKNMHTYSVWEKVMRYKWCTVEVRQALCRNLNLMQRYALWKASMIGRPTPRMLQCAEAWETLPLFEVPYHIIGQHHATEQVQQSILGHRLFENETPLVMLFTGPSGHGKTELARRMGSLLSLDLLVVDCTEMKVETDIFGPKAPYYGHEAGTPLNNHLAKWSGQRAVVFLDEYEKTTDDVRKSMLLLFENGDYKDRRNHKQLDCSKIIWVLAANFGVEIISKFWVNNLQDRSLEQQKKAPFKDLEAALKRLAIKEISAPITGRITEIVPFFPFDKGEQAVTTYKFMRQLWNKVRAPIDTDRKWFPGHSFIDYVDDGRIATLLSKDYNADLGARSLEGAVIRGVQRKVAEAFFGQTEKVTDSMNDGPLPNYNVRVAADEVMVECKGVRIIKCKEDYYWRVRDNVILKEGKALEDMKVEEEGEL